MRNPKTFASELVTALLVSLLMFLGTLSQKAEAQEIKPAKAQAENPQNKTNTSPGQRPNILLVLMDDVGFMDFGAYGSDTSTPNIDKLGESGTMFTRYYTYPLCGPTRASLMTGLDNHLVGAGTLAEVLTDEMRATPAYNMTWQDSQKTIASRLKSAGYETFVSGKWGIGDIGVNLPHRFGFDRSFVLDATGASNYAEMSYLPLYTEVKWFEDGQRISLPGDFYSSRNIVDKMIEYVDSADPEKPFFSYLSFMALHIPLQVPKEYRDKYDGVFDRGWDVMRQERLQRAVDMGLVPKGAELGKPPYNRRPWESLSEKEQAWWARSMQVSAGMMEAADYHLGRLLDHLENKGQLDNTIVIVASDNGPEYNTIGKTSGPLLRTIERSWMKLVGWNTDFDTLGEPGSMGAIGHEWASVSAAPFHLFKFSASEGGVRVPMLFAGPGIAKKGFTSSISQVSDIAPTVLDLADVLYSEDEFTGRSLVPVITGQADSVYSDTDTIAIEVSGTAALYRGNWKITRTAAPFGDGHWHLYDLSADPGETRDLATIETALLNEMIEEFQAYEEEVGVFKMAPGQSSRQQLTINALKKMAKNYWYVLLGLALVLIFAIFVLLKLSKLVFISLKQA